MKWAEVDLDASGGTYLAARMKTGEKHQVPLTDEILAISAPLQAVQSEYDFEVRSAKSQRPIWPC